MPENPHRPPPELGERGVTAREEEVLEALLADGGSNADIALLLGISARTVESHVASLLRKLGASQRAELIGIARNLGRGWRRSLTLPRALADATRAGGFVGRDRELDTLRLCLRASVAGTPQAVFVSGEAGIGKTRLLAEMADEACAGGALTLYGRCDEHPTVPYQALSEAMAPYLEAAPEAMLRARVGVLFGELQRLVPWTSGNPPGLDDRSLADTVVSRSRVFEAVRLVLHTAAADEPVLLVLDDLHWATRPTLALLLYLIRTVAGSRILVVGAFRDDDMDGDLAWFLANVRREITPMRVGLTGLSTVAIGDLLRRDRGAAFDPGDHYARRLRTETDGNPFFVVEMMRHGYHTGAADRVIPDGVLEIVNLRVASLSQSAGAALLAASVLGSEFDVDVLHELCELELGNLLDALDEASRAGLVREQRALSGQAPMNTVDRYTFSHSIVRRALLSRLSSARLRHLHATVVGVLRRLRPDSADRIAWHLVQAEGPDGRDEELPYLISAGRAALHSAAFEEAVRYFELGLSRASSATGAQVAELHYQLGLAERSLASFEPAIAHWRRSLAISRELGDSEAIGRVCAAASYNLIWAVRSADAVDMARTGLDAVGPTAREERCLVLGAHAFAHAWAGHHAESAASVAEGIRAADELDDDVLRGRALAAKAMQHTAFMEHRDAVEAGLAAADLLREAGDTRHLTNLLGFLDMALVGVGRLEEARQIGRELYPLAERLGDYGALSQTIRMRALCDFFRDGDPDALETYARRDIAFCRAVGLGVADHAQGWLGLSLLLRGEWDEAEDALREAMRMEPPATSMVGWAWGLLLECHGYQGKRDQVLAAYAGAADLLPAVGRSNTWGAWVALLSAVESLWAVGEREVAGRLYPAVLDCRDRTGAPWVHFRDGRLLERTAGVAALAARRWDDAAGHLNTALELARTLPHRVEEAHTMRFLGELCIERRAFEGARSWLGRAAQLYRELGMARHAELASSLLTRGTGSRVS